MRKSKPDPKADAAAAAAAAAAAEQAAQAKEVADQLGALDTKIGKLIADLDTSFKECLTTEVTRLSGLIDQKGEVLEKSISATGEDFSKKLVTLREELTVSLDAAAKRIDLLESEVSNIRVEMGQGNGAEDIADQVTMLKQSLEVSRKEAAKIADKRAKEEAERCLVELDKQVVVLRGEISVVNTPVTARCEALQGAVDQLTQDFGFATAEIERAKNELSSGAEQQLLEMQRSIADSIQRASGSVDTCARDLEDRVSGEFDAQNARLRATQMRVENVHARTVSWRCKGFQHRLRHLCQAEATMNPRGLFSPEFSLASLPEMQLEVNLTARSVAGTDWVAPAPPAAGTGGYNHDGTHRPVAPPAPPLPGLVPAAPLPVVSSCTLRLYAQPGLQLAFRITLGDGPHAVTRRFEHTFIEDPDHPRSCFQIINFCPLDQVWVRTTDTIQVSLELLEFKVSHMPVIADILSANPPISVASSPIAVPPSAPSLKDESTEEPAAESKEKETGKEPVAAPEALELPASSLSQPVDPDDFIFSRHATAELLMHERLQRELASIKNKLVRRVEWRLEGCSRLLELCEPGKGVDSPFFSAAGLDKIQFHFYPRGMEVDNTAAVQPCGFFLSGPSRTTLRGTLRVGVTAKQLDHRFQKKGDIGGRGRFCNLQTQLDCDDSVVIGLEIEEVEQDLPDHSSALMLRQVQHRSGIPENPSAPLPIRTGAKGLLRMKREDPSKMEELVKCVSLPTLNARQLAISSLSMSKSRRSMDL
ncbi:unnamed protein product [Polarella glacialis]|uniref:Uncharacterized protein n=1 Tax=Polarella glacialis TaxID=89957 RepID=A0A813HKU7_POLGL|nr:unnamed protein product [Polarella glacialis]